MTGRVRGRMRLETSARKVCKQCTSREVRVRISGVTEWGEGWSTPRMTMQATEADGKLDQRIKEFLKLGLF